MPPEHCGLPGISVEPSTDRDDHPVRPDGTLINYLAPAFAAPAATPLADSRPGRSRQPVPISSPLHAGQARDAHPQPLLPRVVSRAQPAGFPDRIKLSIEYRIRQPKTGRPAEMLSHSTKRAVTAVEAGHTDWADARCGPYRHSRSSLRQPVRVTPTESLHGRSSTPRSRRSTMNGSAAHLPSLPPDASTDDWETPGTVTCQLLLPNFPGYRPYCPYTLRSALPEPGRHPMCRQL